jgi:phosphoenolpyruvate synthase/pyruvate phosphate dikinase
MNNTLPTADLTTHLKIVAVAMAAIILAGLVEIGTQTTPANDPEIARFLTGIGIDSISVNPAGRSRLSAGVELATAP